MRGSRVHRGKNRYALVLDRGYVVDPATGLRKRKQQWVTFHGTRKAAGEKLTELVRAMNRGEFVEPSKMTVGEWLPKWLTTVVEPTKRLLTAATYKHIIKANLVPALGSIRLQALTAQDLQAFYSDKRKLAPRTLRLYHAVMGAALKSALRQGLITRNVATLVEGLPRVEQPTGDSIEANCWTAAEARTVLNAAKTFGPRAAAFYATALDTGARIGELCGLRWSDLDLDAGMVRIQRQLLKPGAAPVFGPPKRGGARTIDLNEQTLALLRAHKKHQAELKLANRTHYEDLGLIFAKEQADATGRNDRLGLPLQKASVGAGEFARVIAAAKVKRITFHGLRHTSASLLLGDGVPVHVVSRRLGHGNPSVTMSVYAHVLPGQQKGAAQQLGALLHG